MEERIPVLDSFGNKVGDFIPTAVVGCGCIPVAAVVFGLLLYFVPIAMLVLPPILFGVALCFPKSNRYRKLVIVLASVLLTLWVVWIIAEALTVLPNLLFW